MNESIQLVVRLMFFNICIPVLSVVPAADGTNPDLTGVKLQSSVEFLSEHGDVVVRRMHAPRRLALHVYEAPEAPEDQWIYGFGAEELGGAEAPVDGRPEDGARHGGADTPAPSKSIAPERPSASTAAADGDGDAQHGPGSYSVMLSRPNYMFFRVLSLLRIRDASLSYEYTELDYIPLVLQILLHIPLVLTGVIIFVVVMTLDPELNANLVKNEIEKLPSTRYTADMGLSSCPVCLDDFVVGQDIRILGCRHSFHKGCIDVWLMHTLKCPICRKGVSDMSAAPQFEMYQTHYYI